MPSLVWMRTLAASFLWRGWIGNTIRESDSSAVAIEHALSICRIVEHASG